MDPRERYRTEVLEYTSVPRPYRNRYLGSRDIISFIPVPGTCESSRRMSFRWPGRPGIHPSPRAGPLPKPESSRTTIFHGIRSRRNRAASRDSGPMIPVFRTRSGKRRAASFHRFCLFSVESIPGFGARRSTGPALCTCSLPPVHHRDFHLHAGQDPVIEVPRVVLHVFHRPFCDFHRQFQGRFIAGGKTRQRIDRLGRALDVDRVGAVVIIFRPSALLEKSPPVILYPRRRFPA